MKDRINRLAQLLKTASPKRLLAIAGLLIVAAAIPFTVAVQQLQQNLQQQAAVGVAGPLNCTDPAGRKQTVKATFTSTTNTTDCGDRAKTAASQQSCTPQSGQVESTASCFKDTGDANFTCTCTIASTCPAVWSCPAIPRITYLGCGTYSDRCPLAITASPTPTATPRTSPPPTAIPTAPVTPRPTAAPTSAPKNCPLSGVTGGVPPGSQFCVGDSWPANGPTAGGVSCALPVTQKYQTCKSDGTWDTSRSCSGTAYCGYYAQYDVSCFNACSGRTGGPGGGTCTGDVGTCKANCNTTTENTVSNVTGCSGTTPTCCKLKIAAGDTCTNATQTCETGTGTTCPTGKTNAGTTGTCTTGKVCCKPSDICTYPSHPDFSGGCPMTGNFSWNGRLTNAGNYNISVYWQKVADVLLNNTCNPPTSNIPNNAGPENNLPGNVYAGTVAGSVISTTQIPKLQYSGQRTKDFVNNHSLQGLWATLNNMFNACKFGAYAGSKTDFQAALKIVENALLAKYQEVSPTLTYHDIIESIGWYDPTFTCLDSINPNGVPTVSDYVGLGANCTIVQPEGSSCSYTGSKCVGQTQTVETCSNGLLAYTACSGYYDTCSAGRCIPVITGDGDGGACNPPKTPCGNVCADTKTDNNNCRSCGIRCASGQTCQNGSCEGGSTGDTKLALTVGLDGLGSTGDNLNPNPRTVTGEQTSNTNPTRKSRNITVEVYGSGSNDPVDTRPGTVVYDAASGKFKGEVNLKSGFASGTYIVKVSSPGYLRRDSSLTQISSSGTTNIALNLTTGDVNGDGDLTILDWNLFLSCSVYSKDNKGACKEKAEFEDQADTTDNGIVDGDDYALFIREMAVIKGD